ncbi:MAG: ATP-dependent DNA helicase [Blastocatellia bacterium]|nr:ATP-dependent DNA helicase [Blastocatellia bacterium]
MEEIFGPEGIIAKHLPSYEYRSGQVRMAEAVYSVMREGGCLLSEAGTGTGKTLAYLVPALALGKRVIVSTATKNLQEQLYNKDVPFLEKILKRRLRVAYLKGRSNYLCLYRLKKVESSPILQGLEDLNHFDEIRRWSANSETGDRAELVTLPENIHFWHEIDARSEICIGQKCPEYDQCFITRTRQKAIEADVVIVNHHLFFADLSLRNNEYGSILPDYAAVVFDEAHEIEDIAASYFGLDVSSFGLAALLQDLQQLALTDREGALELMRVVTKLSAKAEQFWVAFHQCSSGEGRFSITSDIFIRSDGDGNRTLTPIGETYTILDNYLAQIGTILQAIKDAPPELELMVRRIETLRAELRFIVECKDKNYVFWYERRGRAIFLQATPIDVSSILSERLFTDTDAIVLTSATLTSADSFNFIKGRLGTLTTRELKIDSHFNYTSQSLLYLPPKMPEPKNPQFATAAADEILKILDLTNGRAFVLFTSISQMNQVYEMINEKIPFPTFIQGQSSKAGLLERFKKTPNAVLFAVSSFWQGVDVQGESLSCVIIDKLPFAVPTDPVVSARQEYIDAQGGNSFMDYSVPQAIITLKQGLGRLIRSRQDYGVLAILDPRLRTKHYGRMFFESLPACPITTRREDISRIFLRH